MLFKKKKILMHDIKLKRLKGIETSTSMGLLVNVNDNFLLI